MSVKLRIKEYVKSLNISIIEFEKSINASNGDLIKNIKEPTELISLFNNQFDTEPIDYLKIPNLPKCDGALTVKGDGMYPLIKSGDIIIYKKLELELTNIFYGEIYLLTIDISGDEYITIKRIQQSDMGIDYIKLESENKHHQAKDLLFNKVKKIALIKATVRVNAMY